MIENLKKKITKGEVSSFGARVQISQAQFGIRGEKPVKKQRARTHYEAH